MESISCDIIKFKKNPNMKYKELNEIIIRYKSTKKDRDLLEIINLTRSLITSIMGKYNMRIFPPHIYDDVFETCSSIILLDAIEKYQSDRGSFSTWFTYKLMSYIQGKKRDNKKRSLLHNAKPFKEVLDIHDGESDPDYIYPHITPTEKRTYAKKQKLMNDCFFTRLLPSQICNVVETVELTQELAHI
jgi:hypothetical protein